MANTLRFKRGLASGIPTAALGEPLFTTDTFDLYIGNGTGNTRFQKYIASGTTSQLLRGDGSLLTMPIVLTSPSNGQVLKFNGTNWVNDSDAGITGSGANGQVAFFTGATTQTGSNNLIWDNTNGKLIVGKVNSYTNPSPKFFVAGATGSSIGVTTDFLNSGTTASPLFLDYTFLGYANNELARIRSWDESSSNNSGVLTFWTRLSGTLAERARFTFGGNFLLNSTTDNGQRLQVTGTTLLNGSVTFSSATGMFWDATNNRLGIGTNAPSYLLHAFISANAQLYFQNVSQSNLVVSGTNATLVLNTTGANFPGVRLQLAGANIGGIEGNGTSSIDLVGLNSTTAVTFRQVSNERARFAPTTGNFLLNSTTDNGLRFQVTGDGYFSGSVGIGTSGLTGTSLGINKNITGATNSYGVFQNAQIQTDVTAGATGYYSLLGTAASTTLGNLNNFYVVQGSFGAGTAVTNQFGFRVHSSMTGATNNYGFYGDIASGTGRWNLYMNGSASNYVNGNLLIGSTADPSGVGKALISYSSQVAFGLVINNTYTAATNTGYPIRVYNNGTEMFTLNMENLTTSDVNISYKNNLGFNNGVPSGTRRMTLDASGNLGLGVTPSYKMHVFNAGSVTSAIESSGAGTSSALRFISPSNYWLITNDGTNAHLTFNRGGTDLIRFSNLGNLLVGTTTDAGFKLDVNGTMRVSGASTFGGLVTISGSATTLMQITSTGSAAYIGMGDSSGSIVYLGSDDGSFLVQTPGSSFSNKLVINSAGAATFSSTVTGASFIPTSSTIPTNGMYLPSANSLGFATNGTLDMTINSRGDIGIGVTPSTWSLGKSIEINSAGQGITSLQLGDTFIMNGVYYNTSQLRYANSTYAISLYRQFRGVHSWYYAPQGTIGNQVTFDIPMTLETTGNLLLGSTTDDTVNRLQVTGSGKFSSSVTSTQFNLSALNTAPATSSSTGTLGEIRIDADHIYVCTATNTWKRVAISTF